MHSRLGEAPCPARIVIGGNHDGLLQEIGLEGASKLLGNAIYLQNNSCVAGGLRFFGSPASVQGASISPNLAFQSTEFSEEAEDVSQEQLLPTHTADVGLHARITCKDRPKAWPGAQLYVIASVG